MSDELDDVIRQKSSVIVKDIMKNSFPEEDSTFSDIIVEECLSNSGEYKFSKTDKKFGFASPEITLIGELILPLVCSLVIDFTREYYKKKKITKDVEIEKSAYIAAIEFGLENDKAKNFSKEFVKSFKSHINS
jgi:hypothetical protein